MTILAGILGEGTEAASKVASNPAYLDAMLQKAPKKWDQLNLEAVIEANVIEGTPDRQRLLLWRRGKTFPYRKAVSYILKTAPPFFPYRIANTTLTYALVPSNARCSLQKPSALPNLSAFQSSPENPAGSLGEFEEDFV